MVRGGRVARCAACELVGTPKRIGPEGGGGGGGEEAVSCKNSTPVDVVKMLCLERRERMPSRCNVDRRANRGPNIYRGKCCEAEEAVKTRPLSSRIEARQCPAVLRSRTP